MKSSQGASTGRRLASLVNDVEYGPSDHSSALQLLSLGKPRTLLQQPQQPLPQTQPLIKQKEDEPQLEISIATTTMLRDSPIATHGRNRKKRRMLEAQAAASTILRENQINTQIMVDSSNAIAMDTSEQDDNGDNKNNYSRAEAAITLSDFGATTDTTKAATNLDPSSSAKPLTNQIANHDEDNGSETTEQAGGSPLEPKQSLITSTPSKNLGHRRGGSRRHAALPMNRQKTNESNEDVIEDHVQDFESPEPPPVQKSRSGSKSKKSSASKKSSPRQTVTAAKEYVENPTDQDILLGMRKFNSHPGNEVYRQTVRKFQSEIKTKERTEVAKEIIDHIYHIIGGRFLKVDSHNRWEIMPHVDAMTKVGKAIVELRNNGRQHRTEKGSKSVSVLESLTDGDTQVASPTRRPKRKASLGRKLNDFMDETATLPSYNTVRQQTKKPKLPRTQTVRQQTKKPKLPGTQTIRQQTKKPELAETQEKTAFQEDANPTTSRIIPVEQIEPTEPTFEEYIYKLDPNEYYVEETAHIYHNPPFPSDLTSGITIEELRPVPPPPPLPSFPKNDTCKWSFDESTRVLIADFSIGKNGGQPVVTLEDSKFLFEMHEQTDITVISRGLLNMSKVDPSMWNLDYLRKCVGREFYHKFRRFDRIVDENGIQAYTEKDNLYSMRFEAYVEYCEKRESYLNDTATSPTSEEPKVISASSPIEEPKDVSTSSAPEESKDVSTSSTSEEPTTISEEPTTTSGEPTFTFEDHLGKMHSIGVGTSALYMIDVDMKRLTPLLNQNFLESFELPAVLPGGSHCMMNSVTPDAQPFMGPNLYVTPPASFTHFHQDGHGTVDSGHLCISGFNEVVMLRRLTERHKKHALWILSGKQAGGIHFDGLYAMPHGDGLGEKPSWPKTDMIEECKKMGYCPSVFTLEPGDLIHINKGRLHAFRKMSTSKLPEWDCHAEHRRNLIESKGIAGEEKLCVSIAWDWMYRGVTPAGINREVCTVLEGSTLNRRNGVTSLAIPELALLQMAKSVPARSLTSPRGISFLGAFEKKEKRVSVYESTKAEICEGIYPGLCIVVGQHIHALNVKESKSTEKGARLSIAKIPDTQENPQTCPLDPYGDSDFACKLCRKELSNVYFHCDGCEKLLSKDFNVCRGCYLQGKFKMKVQMHPSNPKRHATLNHMGETNFNRQSRCPCKNGPACNYCGFCLGCSCRCHTWFTMRTRLCSAADEEQLLQTVKDTAAVKTASKSIKTEGVQTTGVFGVDESTKYLRDRLKDAGDDELLHEDKKDDTEVKEEDDEKLTTGDMKDKATAKEDDDKRLPNDIKKENVEEKLTNDDKTDEAKVKEEDVRLPSDKESENVDEKLMNDDKKDNAKAQDDNDERLLSGIKKEHAKEKDMKKNGIANEDNGPKVPIIWDGVKEIGDDEEILI